MDKTILECALKRMWKDSTPEKVLSMEEAPAVGKNLNFLSTVKRLSVKVILHNGRVVNQSFILKEPKESESESETKFRDKYGIFQTETKTYNALTQLEYLMEEFEDTEDVLWCKMIHDITKDKGRSILLEDLKSEGFYMIEKEVFYDLDHILLAVHSLGRYHGMFKTLEERGILSSNGLGTWCDFSNEEMQDGMCWDLHALARCVKKLWDPSWTPIVEQIKLSEKEVREKLSKLREVDENKFNVINHGDCHKYNILFKYNWDKRPILLRFVDFQLLHYGSPCIDLTYMLYLAVQPSVRRDKFDLILRTYHNALVTTLDRYQFKGNKPNLDEIKDGMEKHSFMGLILVLSWYPSLINSEKIEELRDFEKIEETKGIEGYSDENFKPEELEEAIGPDINAFVKKFCKSIE